MKYFRISYYFKTVDEKRGFGDITIKISNDCYPNRATLVKSLKDRDEDINNPIFLNIEKLTKEEYEAYTKTE